MASPCFIIAEIGINHNGDLRLAKETIAAAKDSGVDAVKFQTFKAEDFITDDKLEYTYTSQGESVTESQLSMFKRYEITKAEWAEIFRFCKEIDICCFTTPQNKTDLDFILSITDLPYIKIGSDDLTNLELIEYYASTGIPVILSTGMSYEIEIEEAIRRVHSTGNKNLTVLHCISSYPAEDFEVNLAKMLRIRDKFGVDIGFSDHTKDELASVLACSLGAKVVEKHFTLSNSLPGPDHVFSSNPSEMKQMVNQIRRISTIFGSPELVPTDRERDMRAIARRSIVAKRDLPIGHKILRRDLDFKRPGTGLPPKKVEDILGRELKKKKKKNEIMKYEDLS